MDEKKVFDEKFFIQKYLIDDVKFLIDNRLYYLALVIITQSIEFFGSYLDNKPMRARGQSKARFNKAFDKLFPAHYQFANRNNWLYDKLRNHVAHAMVPSAYILITSKTQGLQYKHLSRKDKKTVLVIEDFHADLIKAADKLLALIASGKVKAKNIESSDLDFGS